MYAFVLGACWVPDRYFELYLKNQRDYVFAQCKVLIYVFDVVEMIRCGRSPAATPPRRGRQWASRSSSPVDAWPSTSPARERCCLPASHGMLAWHIFSLLRL